MLQYSLAAITDALVQEAANTNALVQQAAITHKLNYLVPHHLALKGLVAQLVEHHTRVVGSIPT